MLIIGGLRYSKEVLIDLLFAMSGTECPSLVPRVVCLPQQSFCTSITKGLLVVVRIRVSAKEDFSVLGIPLSELSHSAEACWSGTSIEKLKGIKGSLAGVSRYRKKGESDPAVAR